MIVTDESIHGTPVCSICSGASTSRRIYCSKLPGHPIPFGLWRCADCGVVFNHPRLSPAQIRGQYDGEYYVFNESPARRWARATQLYVEHLLPLEAKAGERRLLEIGCAGGELLALSRYRGWQVTGIEISPEASASARREYSLDVLTGTLEEHAGEIGTFDVAISTDVIEHVPSPRTFVESIHGAVKPGGRAIVETPNWGSVWRRLGGPAWLGINRFHIFLFDGPSLVRLMSECGFSECTAATSTNLAYTSWASRPELTRLTRGLPAALRWRFEHWADRLTPSCFALELHRKPPAELEQALAVIAMAQPSDSHLSNHLWNDNLSVIGRA